MSEPIYEQVLNDKLLSELYQNVERFRQVTREVERITEQIHKARNELRNCEAERKALMNVIRDLVQNIEEEL